MNRSGRLVAIAAIAAAVGVPGAVWLAPAASADGATLYAYAQGGADGPDTCPPTNDVRSQCTLEQALGLTEAFDTVALATPGSTSHYYGNWDVFTGGLTIQPADGVAQPTLDGDDGGHGGKCTTNACDSSILGVFGDF